MGTSVIPIFADRETEAQGGKAPGPRLGNSGGGIPPGTSRDWGRGVPTLPELSGASLPARRGRPWDQGSAASPVLSHPHPPRPAHLALDVEDEDSRGGHGGNRRTREAGRERREATAAPLPPSCGSGPAQVSAQVRAS